MGLNSGGGKRGIHLEDTLIYFFFLGGGGGGKGRGEGRGAQFREGTTCALLPSSLGIKTLASIHYAQKRRPFDLHHINTYTCLGHLQSKKSLLDE